MNDNMVGVQRLNGCGVNFALRYSLIPKLNFVAKKYIERWGILWLSKKFDEPSGHVF